MTNQLTHGNLLPDLSKVTLRRVFKTDQGWIMEAHGQNSAISSHGRGVNVTVPVLKFLTFWSRKSAGATIAAQNGCLATISELALAARAPDKTCHHCVLLGHSFGGLVLENTISHSILDASSNGSRNTSPWDMAVAFNAADSSIGRRQLMSEL